MKGTAKPRACTLKQPGGPADPTWRPQMASLGNCTGVAAMQALASLALLTQKIRPVGFGLLLVYDICFMPFLQIM